MTPQDNDTESVSISWRNYATHKVWRPKRLIILQVYQLRVVSLLIYTRVQPNLLWSNNLR